MHVPTDEKKRSFWIEIWKIRDVLMKGMSMWKFVCEKPINDSEQPFLYLPTINKHFNLVHL